MKQTNQGFFLHRTPFSDSSLIVTFYTLEKGIQKYLFKGGKKKSAGLFPMALCELEYYGRPESTLLNLTKAESKANLTFQFDPVKASISYFFAEIVLKCFQEENEDPYVFEFLKNQVSEFDKTEKVSFFPIQFLVALTDQFGIQPYLQNENGRYFNLDDGEISDYNSSLQRTASGKEVELIIEIITGMPLHTDEFPKTIRQKALETMLTYLSIHVPNFQKLKSYKVIQELLYS